MCVTSSSRPRRRGWRWSADFLPLAGGAGVGSRSPRTMYLREPGAHPSVPSRKREGKNKMLGAMQDFALRVPRLIEHAAREHGGREIVTSWADGSETRTDWAGIARDARRL